MRNLQEFIISGTLFISNTLLPLFFGLALLFFIWNAFRFFILNPSDVTAKDSAKNLAFYGIGAFVLLVSIWGIVNLFINGLGLNSNNYATPDYMLNDPFYRENVRQAEYCRQNPNSLDCR